MPRIKLVAWQTHGDGARSASTAHFNARMERIGADRTTSERIYRCRIFAGRSQRDLVLREHIVGLRAAVDWVKWHLRRLEQGKALAIGRRSHPLGREVRP